MCQERTMRTRIGALLSLVLAVALLALVACGGDDSKAERKTRDRGQEATATSQSLGSVSGATSASTDRSSGATGAASGTAPAGPARTLQLDCGRDFKAFRFNGRLSTQTPQGSSGADSLGVFGALLGELKFSGAFVAPDRSQIKLEGGKDSPIGAIEFVQIGNTAYTRFGSTAWQQTTGGGPADLTENLDPREFCRQIQQSLTAEVPSRKEKVNGVDATRYEYDRTTLERLGGGGFLGATSGGSGELPENAKLTLWVSEKEKFPVKMAVSASGQQRGERFAFDMELNVTDLNDSGIKIEPPR